MRKTWLPSEEAQVGQKIEVQTILRTEIMECEDLGHALQPAGGKCVNRVPCRRLTLCLCSDT